MERIVQYLKVFWRSERLIRQNELGLLTRKILINGMAGLIAIFGLVMVSLATFFVLAQNWGQPLAALAIGCVDLLLSVILLMYAGSLKPAPEVQMIKEMRDMALTNISDEVGRAESELLKMKKDVQQIIRNPLDVILPQAIGPLLTALTSSFRSVKKEKES
jgi:glucose uptake protein GlcU